MAEPGGHQQHHRARHDGDRLRPRKVADVAPDHGKIDLAGSERIGRIGRVSRLNHVEPHRRLLLRELAGQRGDQPARLAVQRPHRNGQRCRLVIPAPGKQTGARNQNGDPRNQGDPQPDG